MAIGGAGGALVGGFLTHEWDEHKERRKEDEWRREERSEEDEIARLKRQNQGLQSEERREERRDYDDRYRDSGNTYIENTYVDDRRDDVVYNQQDNFSRDDVYERRDEYVQDDYVREDYERRDDYRDQGLVSELADDVSGWAGREEGRVERFDDGVVDSFDDGRDRERYDDY